MHNNLKNLVNTFISSVIEGIAQDVTERIDTVDNESVRQIATDIVVDYDYTNIVSDHATDVVDNYDFNSVVEEGIDAYDFEDTITDVVDSYDFPSVIEEAIDNIDFDSKVNSVLSVTDFTTYVQDVIDETDFDTRVNDVLEDIGDIDTKVRHALEELDVKADCDKFADRLSVLESRQDLIITALTNATDALRGLTDTVSSNQI